MSSLYEINKAILEFRYEFDEDGIWINEDEFEQLGMERNEKIENTLLYAKNLRAEAKAIRDEEEALKERRKAKERLADRLEDNVAFSLDGENFETPRVKASFRNTESVEIDDEEAVPKEFKNFTVIGRPVKSEIKKYLARAEADGIEVPWARIVRRKSMSVK